MSALTIVHLYPRELGINGDAGNVTALQTRARWRGIPVTVHHHHPGGELPDQIDLIHIGSGPVAGQRAVHSDVLRIAQTLTDAASAGVPVLAIAGGWQLLSRGVQLPDGEQLVGAGVFPSRTVLDRNRAVGEIVARAQDTVLAGFENHSGTTTLEDGAEPLARVLSGVGNTQAATGEQRVEGIRIGASIGTHLHGPFLPMNPAIADQLLRSALRHGDAQAAWPESDAITRVDAHAAKAREAIAKRLGVR